MSEHVETDEERAVRVCEEASERAEAAYQDSAQARAAEQADYDAYSRARETTEDDVALDHVAKSTAELAVVKNGRLTGEQEGARSSEPIFLNREPEPEPEPKPAAKLRRKRS